MVVVNKASDGRRTRGQLGRLDIGETRKKNDKGWLEQHVGVLSQSSRLHGRKCWVSKQFAVKAGQFVVVVIATTRSVFARAKQARPGCRPVDRVLRASDPDAQSRCRRHDALF